MSVNDEEKRIAEEDAEFELILQKAMKEFGIEVRKLMEVRRAKGLPDLTYDMSPDRQQHVLSMLQAEIERQRPNRERLLYGKKRKNTCT